MVALNAVLFAGVEQNAGADDIGAQEKFGVFNRAVDVTFRREIYNGVGRHDFKQLVNFVAAGNIAVNELEMRIGLGVLERFEVAGVGELVVANNVVVGVIGKLVVNEIGADKARAARHNNFHRFDSFRKISVIASPPRCRT